MRPVYVHASGSYGTRVTEAPADLKAALREQTGHHIRRTNRFIDLALLGGHRCVQDRDLPSSTGIYLATGQGDAASSAEMVRRSHRDGITPMPFEFINVSSNAAGFTLAQSLGLDHVNLMISRRRWSFEMSLQLAMLDLAASQCEMVLLGAVDECAMPLAWHRERLGLAVETAVGEGSHWFLLSREPAHALAEIHPPVFLKDRAALERLLAEHGKSVSHSSTGWNLAQEADGDNDLPGQQLDYLEQAGYYDTNVGAGLDRFLELAAPGDRWLHVEAEYGSGEQAQYAVLEVVRA